jgi:hypothetical protein
MHVLQLKVRVRNTDADPSRQEAWRARVTQDTRDCHQSVSDFLLHWDLGVAIFKFEVAPELSCEEVRLRIQRALKFADHGPVMAEGVSFEVVVAEGVFRPESCRKTLPAGKILGVDLIEMVEKARQVSLGFMNGSADVPVS